MNSAVESWRWEILDWNSGVGGILAVESVMHGVVRKVASRQTQRERERERESNRRATTTIAIGSVCFPAIQWRKDCKTHLPKDSAEPISQSLLPINALELGSSSYPGAAKLQLLVSCLRSSLCLYLLSSFLFLFFWSLMFL